MPSWCWIFPDIPASTTSAVLKPAQALEYLQRIVAHQPRTTVVGIAGPGDPFANAEATLDTLRRVRAAYPQMLLCVATNGLALTPHVPDLAKLQVSHVTLTVNAVTALDAGAQAVSVTVNGLGERAGNAALEQVVMALALGGRLPATLRTEHLAALCDAVAQASGRPISAGQPVVGGAAHLHESGIHCHGMLRDFRSYEPFAPEAIGRRRRPFVIGRHSGRAARATAGMIPKLDTAG